MSFLGFPLGAGESALGPSPPTGTSGAGVPTGQALAISQAASKYNVPINLLVGVYGLETSFGANKSTSSAGAIGPFQFLPSTAKPYGYPLTNTPTPGQFQQQSDAAARYLSDLFKQTGNWDTALRRYSGGGYGISQVQAKAQSAPTSLKSIVNATGFTTVPAAAGVAQAAADTASWVPHLIKDTFDSAVNDLKYGVVLLAALAVAVVLMTHGVRGSGGGESRKIVPVPV